jgi:tripartite-type tricarboxylate transporter receptor subunit TctC
MAAAQFAAAQDFPAKPVRIVVPFPAGSSPDVVIRVLSPRLTEALGQPVVVENRTGAAGVLGATSVARAEPDGYTLMYTINSVITANPHLYSKLQYDPVKSFAPVTQVVGFGYVLLASNKSPFQDFKGMLELARAQPGRLNYSSAGQGSGNHVLMELLVQVAGNLAMMHIPTRDPVVSIVSGETDVSFVASTNGVPVARSGRARALAVSLERRLAVLPDVPAVAELVPGYGADGWHGIFAPAGTPALAIARLSEEVARALKAGDIAKRLADVGLEPVGSTPEAFAAKVQADLEKWGRVIRNANIKLD